VLFFFSTALFSQVKVPIDVGYFSAHEGQAQHINLSGLYGNDYSVNRATPQNFLVGTGLYFPSKLSNLDIGLNVYYFNTTGISGEIKQEGLFNNLSYNYNVINIPIYVSLLKEIPIKNKPYSLMLHTGIGPNIIALYNYSETPLTSYTLSNHTFTSSTKAQFSVHAGLGVQLKEQFECGYRFFYLGQSHLKTSNPGVLNSLQTSNMYANSLICSLII
jgi:hypothetical protein